MKENSNRPPASLARQPLPVLTAERELCGWLLQVKTNMQGAADHVDKSAMRSYMQYRAEARQQDWRSAETWHGNNSKPPSV